MFSNDMGARVHMRGREFLRIGQGETGHAVYGPYDHVRPGVFEVTFDLARAGPPPEGDPVCATLDIAALNGVAILASRELRVSDLDTELRTFSLVFKLRDFRSLEYRVRSTGTVDLLIGLPKLTKLGEVTDEAPPADPRQPTTDPAELHRQVRQVLRLLKPCRVKDFRKIRVGHAGDGGYVCIDDFDKLDTALSFGINDDISWDMEAADRGLTIYQFDHTVPDPAPDDPRMIFAKKMIAPESGPNSASLSDLIRAHDKGEKRPNMILKIDIEGDEWDVIGATSSTELSRFSQILCELHRFQDLIEVDFRRVIYDGLRKLNESYAVAHIHANINGGISNMGNVIFPNVLEVTFVNRAIYEIEDTDELFPGPLDLSCDADQPDMYLGSFRF